MTLKKEDINNAGSGKHDDYVVLAHTDYLIDVAERRSRGETEVMKRRHLPTLRAGGVDLICDHVGGDTRMFSTFPLSRLAKDSDKLGTALNGVDCMLEETKESSDDLMIVRTIDEAEQAKSTDKLGIIFCLQGGGPIRQDLGLLRVFYRLGIRCIHLTANVRNQISDSCMDRDPGGLTQFGLKVVREMNRLGIVIDVAQLSPKGCHDVLEESTDPIIASNSNARSLCDHPRNLDDDVIKRIGEKRGVIGVHCLPALICEDKKASLSNLIEHIDYIVDLTGPEHVGIGPDLLENWPEERYNCVWGAGQDLGGKYITFKYPTGLESIAEIPNISVALSENGYSDAEIAGIMGGNLMRVFKAVWNG